MKFVTLLSSEFYDYAFRKICEKSTFKYYDSPFVKKRIRGRLVKLQKFTHCIGKKRKKAKNAIISKCMTRTKKTIALQVLAF